MSNSTDTFHEMSDEALAIIHRRRPDLAGMTLVELRAVLKKQMADAKKRSREGASAVMLPRSGVGRVVRSALLALYENAVNLPLTGVEQNLVTVAASITD